MGKKLTGKALAKFEAERDVWQEVLDGVREIKGGRGKAHQGRSQVSGDSRADEEWFVASRVRRRPWSVQAHVGTVGARAPGAVRRSQAVAEDRRAAP